MRVVRDPASETEGRRGFSDGTSRGGSLSPYHPKSPFSGPWRDRPARHHEPRGVLLTPRLVAHDQLQAVTHFRVSLQGCTP